MPHPASTAHAYGRYAVAEPPSRLARLHFHKGEQLREVDHEPKVAVLDQQDLLAQGIRCSTFVPGCRTNPDALGSCTANATTSALSNVVDQQTFFDLIGAKSYRNPKAAEKWAIGFYAECTHQTGDPATEWPPTDCGSSGPYIIDECERLGLAGGDRIAAHTPEDIVSLVQDDGALVGQPFLAAWETPGPDAMIDGDGKVATLEAQIAQGVAGGHETYLSAIEKLALTETGAVDPFNTILRFRNSWGPSWGDHGSYRAHLSTYLILGGSVDIRRLEPAAEAS